jgi:hypothetical protein
MLHVICCSCLVFAKEIWLILFCDILRR